MKFRHHTLDDAVLDARFNRYVQYRLSYFLGFNLLFLLIDGIEFWLMHEQIPAAIIERVIVLRLLAGLIGKGWWGALELLREGVRGKFSFQNKSGTSALIAHWLALSVFVATICNMIAWWFFIDPGPPLLDSTQRLLFYAYVGSFFMQIYIECFLGSYHAGAYAISRIYRPFKWFCGIALFNFMLLLTLWKLLGVSGLPLAFSIGLLANAMGRFIYVTLTYRKLGLDPLIWPAIRGFKKFLYALPWKLFLMGALAGGSLHLEFFPLVLLLGELGMTFNMMLFLFLQRQLFRCLVQWSTLFYYDLKKARHEYYPLFYERFVARFRMVSVWVTMICYAVGVGIAYLLYPDSFPLLALILGAFFLPCSYLAFLQIDAFGHNRFADLIASSGMALASFYAIVTLGEGYLWWQGASIIVLLGALLFYFQKPRLKSQDEVEAVKKQSFYALHWFRRRFSQPHDLYLLNVYSKYGADAMDKLMSDFSELIHFSGFVVPLNMQQILILEPSLQGCLTYEQIQKVAAGTITTQHVAKQLSWEQCVAQIKQHLFTGIDDNPFLQILGPNHRLQAVDDSFRVHFARGIIIDVGREEQLLSSLPSPAHGAIVYRSAKAFFTYYPANAADSRRYMSAFLIQDDLLKLYLIPTTRADRYLFKKWQVYLHYLNWGAMR